MPLETTIYPASITLPGETRPIKSKLYLNADKRLQVFARPTGGEVSRVASFEGAAITQGRGRTFVVTLEDGTELIGKRLGGGGCNCDALMRFDERAYQEPA